MIRFGLKLLKRAKRLGKKTIDYYLRNKCVSVKTAQKSVGESPRVVEMVVPQFSVLKNCS